MEMLSTNVAFLVLLSYDGGLVHCASDLPFLKKGECILVSSEVLENISFVVN